MMASWPYLVGTMWWPSCLLLSFISGIVRHHRNEWNCRDTHRMPSHKIQPSTPACFSLASQDRYRRAPSRWDLYYIPGWIYLQWAMLTESAMCELKCEIDLLRDTELTILIFKTKKEKCDHSHVLEYWSHKLPCIPLSVFRCMSHGFHQERNMLWIGDRELTLPGPLVEDISSSIPSLCFWTPADPSYWPASTTWIL